MDAVVGLMIDKKYLLYRVGYLYQFRKPVKIIKWNAENLKSQISKIF